MAKHVCVLQYPDVHTNTLVMIRFILYLFSIHLCLMLHFIYLKNRILHAVYMEKVQIQLQSMDMQSWQFAICLIICDMCLFANRGLYCFYYIRHNRLACAPNLACSTYLREILYFSCSPSIPFERGFGTWKD